MTDTMFLSIAYIESKPERAARTLESLHAEDAAALMATVPVRIAAMALARMNVWSGARCIEHIPVERAAGIIEQMPFLDAAALLRMASDGNREAIFEALAVKLARAFRNSLAFPPGTVGAQMDKLAPSMEATRTVADALKYARQKRRPKGDIVFLTDAERNYMGIIRISELVRHDGKVPLSDIMEADVLPLLARSSLSAIESVPAWDRQSVLPVVGRKGNFLGALSRADLAAAKDTVNAGDRGSGGATIIHQLVTCYAVTVYGLLKLILQPGNPQAEGEQS